MADAGVDNILVTFPIVGPRKADRFAALAERISIAAVLDSMLVAEGLSEALAARGTEAAFLVECDTGLGRTGVQSPEAAAELGLLASRLPSLSFRGFMTYPTLPPTGPWLRTAVELARDRGLQPDWVSAGGTPRSRWDALVGASAITEVRAGTYIYGDRMCLGDGTMQLADCALRIRTTIVSRPTADRGIADAGSKALTSDTTPSLRGWGHIVEYPDATVYALHEEHGLVDFERCETRPEVGEVVSLIPNHACGTTNMHDEIAAHRGGEVIDIWPIAARGKYR
jgi:D-serine deaminase-like pyridoxal phosphate-dependent protein